MSDHPSAVVENEPDTKDLLRFLPAHLRTAAAKLPPGKQHTVLELPPEGEGHNAGLIKLASICYKMGVSFDETVNHLRNVYSETRADHHTAPLRAVTRIWQGEGELPPDPEDKPETPDLQEELLLRFRRTAMTNLVEASPHKTNIKPAAIIEALFDPEEIINIQITRFEAGTLVRVKDLRDKFPGPELATYKFLNPSVFKKVEGVPNPLDNGKVATRCNANVKARPYMVLEMDSKDEAQLERFTTFAMEMAKFIPLAMAVHTGGKSIHFWFDARKAKPATISAAFALACLHGADKALGVRSQIARMPNVSASDEGRSAQRVLYYDPDRENYPDPQGDWDLPGFEQFIQKSKQLSYYYLGDKSGTYYGQSNTNSWISFNRTSLTNQLARQGFRKKPGDGEVLSPVEEIIASIEMDKSIEAALKGASGRHAGYYEENGFRFLVLKSPKFIKPQAGDWPTIRGFLEHMLDHDDMGVQLGVFYGWLSASMRDLRNNGRRIAKFTPAQMLHIVGPGDSGKSLLLKYILPACFGGRSAEADDLFEDRGASFNSDMFQSELLYLDDSDVLQTDHKFRAKFGERIKSFTVGAGGSYHQKFGDKVPVPPWWRIVRMMNDEPYTIATLPPMEAGIVDKLIILKAQSMEGGKIDKSKPGWFEPVLAAIRDELPAFIHYLLEVHRIPTHLQDPSKRYAVISHINPTIVDSLSEDSPEGYLMHRLTNDCFKMLFFKDDPFSDTPPEGAVPWKGTSAELYELLSDCGSHTVKHRFQKVVPSPRILAGILRNIERGNPGFAAYSGRELKRGAKTNGKYYWTLDPLCINNHPPIPDVSEIGITEEDCF